MKVFNVSAGQDTGGQMIRMKRGFDRHSTTWTMRAYATSGTYIQYPEDIGRPPSGREARALLSQHWLEADVAHVHRHLTYFTDLDKVAIRPVVLNHHGTSFRAGPAEMLREAKRIGAVSVVSTIDLLAFDPDLIWLPAPYQLDQLRAIRKAHRSRSKTIRIAHAPTDRRIKSTVAVEAAMAVLAKRHPIEFDLVENVPWEECLARKAKADIIVDQFTLGYGCNAIEGWAMGIPVVAGTTSRDTRTRMLKILGELPFFEATADTLVERIEALILDKSLRSEWGQRGQAYVEKYHDDAVVVRQTEALYEQAIAQRKPTPIMPYSPISPMNRLVPVTDHLGMIRMMTPARARLRGFLPVEAA